VKDVATVTSGKGSQHRQRLPVPGLAALKRMQSHRQACTKVSASLGYAAPPLKAAHLVLLRGGGTVLAGENALAVLVHLQLCDLNLETRYRQQGDAGK